MLHFHSIIIKHKLAHLFVKVSLN